MGIKKKGYAMKDFNKELLKLQAHLEQMRQNIPPSKQIKKPTPILSHHLEALDLISKEVKGGKPILNVHLLDSCNYGGCIPSSSGIHTVTLRKKVPDLKPRVEQDERGNYKPVLDENDEPIFDLIHLEYNTASVCPYCGLINKYLLRLKKSGIGADALRKHFNNYEMESNELKEKTQSFLDGDFQGGLLWGKAGNGKTHLLSAMARELIWRGHKIRYVSHQHLLEEVKRSFDGEQDPRVKWLDGIDYVFFDELGFCAKTEWAKQTTNELIHSAHASGVKIMFASNLSPNQLKNSLLDMRTSSRMGEMVGDFVYQMRGNDRRGGF